MKRVLTLLIALLPLTALAVGPAETQLNDRARIYRSTDGGALTVASRAPHADIMATFLRDKGHSASSLKSLVAVSENRVERTGITHHRMGQQVSGLEVYGAYSKIAIDSEGRIVSAIDRLVDTEGGVRPAKIREARALELALNALYGSERPEMHERPTIERVAVPMNDGSLREGFLVETWTEETNQLHHTLVSGLGQILNIELRTASDSYKVFTVDPNTTPQTTVNGPAPGGQISPDGWLYTSGHTTFDISGNNVHAYLDTDANNASDGGGTQVTDGNFTTTANFSQQPSTSTNKAVAVQNLFYLNNVMHDTLYGYGFTEAVGNFQENNFGRGGLGGDSVNAEAQDGSGTDNANFSTPSDGNKPRMQMYLFNGVGDHLVTVGANTYLAMGAEFGPTLNTTGVTGTAVFAGDGCTAITANVSGNLAVIDRGTCAFVDKVKAAQNAGAIGAIVVNNAGDGILAMGGTDNTINIPSVFVGQSDGDAIKAAATTTKISANPNQPLMKDGDLDSDIVFHEYGHGLTWRMIGSMSGAMSGAIGEGMGDVLSLLMNEHDVVGTYATGDSRGIRRYPYTDYPLTYGDFTGDEVHNDGEIYAAAVWKVYQIFQANSVSKDTLFGYIVDGMNYTPAGPTMEEMRDGILQAAAGNAAHQCLVWEGFAAYGIGQGAQARSKGPRYTVTESFTVPSSCSGGTSNNPPTAAFNWTTNGLTVTFQNNSSDSDGTIASSSWNFGDSTSSTATNPSHTYAADGSYSVTLTVTDNDGATANASNMVSVSAPSGGGIQLSVVAYKVKGVQHADLTWSGASGNVSITRDGNSIATNVSGSSYTDNIGAKGPGVYSYVVCDSGACSAPVQIVF